MLLFLGSQRLVASCSIDSPFSIDKVFHSPPSKTMQLRINDYIRRQGCLLSQQEPNFGYPFSDDESAGEDDDF